MYLLVSAVLLLLVVGALIDIITRQDGQVNHLPKMVWILLVVFLPLIGSIIWFAVGRDYNTPAGRGSAVVAHERTATPRQAEFVSRPTRTTEEELAELEREIAFHEQQARLSRLEAELKERRKLPE